MAPIMDQLRPSARADRTASTSCSSMASRRVASSLMSRSEAVSDSTRSAGSTRSAHSSRALASCALDRLIAATNLSRTSDVPPWHEWWLRHRQHRSQVVPLPM